MIGPQLGDRSPQTLTATNRRVDHKRIYPALVFAPLFYLLLRYSPPIAFFGFVTVFALLALWEFYRLQLPYEGNQGAFIIGLGGAALLLASMQWASLLPFPFAVSCILLIILSYQVLWHSTPTKCAEEIIILSFGVLYIGLTLGHLVLLRQLPEGEFLIFFLILVTWAADTAGYYVGKLFGRRQLASRLSPNKTIEGFGGGLIFAPIVALLAHYWFLPSLSMVDCVANGLLLTVVGLIGDLSESAFKRRGGVKDSGGLIPGHGGILDRLDSLLLTAPTFYYYMVLIKG